MYLNWNGHAIDVSTARQAIDAAIAAQAKEKGEKQ